MTRIISSLTEIANQYDALFVDLWGCVHNGIIAYPEAVSALQGYRAKGGSVILVTNSPKPRRGVEKQLANFSVPDDCWDAIATSGDSARAAMLNGAVGDKVWFMGDRQDSGFFEPMAVIENPASIERVPLDQATGIVCCSPFDPEADPEVNRQHFLYAKTKGLKLLCANPDIQVDRGDHREWCAGALARLYTEMGGESLYFGKPHPPIYDLARRRLAALGKGVRNSSILAIGDGIHTDIQGALGENIDSLFITGGLAQTETRTTIQPDPGALRAFIDEAKITPTYAIGRLR